MAPVVKHLQPLLREIGPLWYILTGNWQQFSKFNHSSGTIFPVVLCYKRIDLELPHISPEKGGEFVITDEKLTVTESLKPSCGDIVGFRADTYHGVKAIDEGERYAIGNQLIFKVMVDDEGNHLAGVRIYIPTDLLTCT